MTEEGFDFKTSPFNNMAYEDVGFNVRVFNKENEYWFLEVISYVDEEWGEYCEVRCILSGNLYFDGFRHLYFGERPLVGTETKDPHWGYLYCMNIKELKQIVDKLEEIDLRVNKEHLKYR